jgi:hypothetical protein
MRIEAGGRRGETLGVRLLALDSETRNHQPFHLFSLAPDTWHLTRFSGYGTIPPFPGRPMG